VKMGLFLPDLGEGLAGVAELFLEVNLNQRKDLD